jgi:hypothetical protein
MSGLDLERLVLSAGPVGLMQVSRWRARALRMAKLNEGLMGASKHTLLDVE